MSSSKTKIEELVIEGITYVPKESIKEEYKVDIKIVILQRGWVYIGRFEKDNNGLCKLHNSYNIRTWGTTKGLPELVHGPTTNTKLDKCEGIVEFDWLTVIHTITVNQEKWKSLI
jgi:hypothetical protein